ncbi:MAG: hypothetical protein M1445_03040, partial [Bacteroidetes bacterium]|nr:hypothetical protein [Bacteroidota bacterium]
VMGFSKWNQVFANIKNSLKIENYNIGNTCYIIPEILSKYLSLPDKRNPVSIVSKSVEYIL